MEYTITTARLSAPELRTQGREPAPVEVSTMASLVFTEGPLKGTLFPLDPHHLISIGRDEDCTIQVLDPLVSRHHVQVRLDAASGRHVAADYRSANGVVVNGKRIVADAPLADGDAIRIGSTTIVYAASNFPDADTAMLSMRKRGEWKRSTLMRE
jgi:pSer/pThr/pTyr-binding forkhead associated (FHA) protein